MNKMVLKTDDQIRKSVTSIYDEFYKRIVAGTNETCPIDMLFSFVKTCEAQTCGKCVPCRIGLKQISVMLKDLLDYKAHEDTLKKIIETAESISNTADCAIGYETAKIIIKVIEGFKEDFESHIKDKICLAHYKNEIPCVSGCPASVDIPGYIALVKNERYDDAVKLIRKDNPFPTACALICEHPCEKKCRRQMIDAPINIRLAKKMAVDNARKDKALAPKCQDVTGKKIAIIGGGPSGLTCAYFLKLMGHDVDIYEKNDKLGGMLRYGIPAYRFPRERLDEDINFILSTGINVKYNSIVGTDKEDVSLNKLRKDYDAVYVAIGAHTDKKLDIEGIDAKGVMSAVELLKILGDGKTVDMKGKNVIVVGGGNVAMDCARSSIRLGAKVSILYRRRKEDMTALLEEIDGAMAEGCELLELMAPKKIEKDANGNVKAFVVEPQIIGEYDKGRPKPIKKDAEDIIIPCDMVIVAVGQDIVSKPFEEEGLPVKRNVITSTIACDFNGIDGVFAGGDCATAPATVIRAIAAGKVAARNIDIYLGYNHKITVDVEIPNEEVKDILPSGRINIVERPANERKNDFKCIECDITKKEADMECGRCLRCDLNGFGKFRGGRKVSW